MLFVELVSHVLPEVLVSFPVLPFDHRDCPLPQACLLHSQLNDDIRNREHIDEVACTACTMTSCVSFPESDYQLCSGRRK